MTIKLMHIIYYKTDQSITDHILISSIRSPINYD